MLVHLSELRLSVLPIVQERTLDAMMAWLQSIISDKSLGYSKEVLNFFCVTFGDVQVSSTFSCVSLLFFDFEPPNVRSEATGRNLTRS